MSRSAGKVIWHVTMTLDGFIAGPDHAMDWAYDSGGSSEIADSIVQFTGALVVGRHSYEVEDRDRRGFYGGEFTGPFFVVTHSPPATVPDWMTGTFVSDGIGDAVARAQAAAGEKNVVVLGADIARQCLENGLLDEVVVSLVPALLGDGVRLFQSPGGRWIELEPIEVLPSERLTEFRFRVVK